MSFSFGPAIPQPPVPINQPVRDDEAPAPGPPVYRTLDLKPALGATGGPGNITSLDTVTVTIARQDGTAITSADVSLVPANFSVDATGFLLTVAFQVPSGLPYAVGASTIIYTVTVWVDPAGNGWPWKRDFLLTAAALLG